MNQIVHAAPVRNEKPYHQLPNLNDLTVAGRAIWRRTGWSVPLANAVAEIAFSQGRAR